MYKMLRLSCFLAGLVAYTLSFGDDGALAGASDLEIIVTGATSSQGRLRVAIFSLGEAHLFLTVVAELT